MLFSKHFFKYYIKYIIPYAIGIGVLLVIDFVQLYIPEYIGNIIDELRGNQNVSYMQGLLLNIGLLVIGITVGRFIWRYTIFGASRRIQFDLMNTMFIHATNLQQSFYSEEKVGGLMAYYTNDLETIRNAYARGILMLVDGLALGTFAVIRMIRLNATMTLYAGIPMVLMLVFLIFILRSRPRPAQSLAPPAGSTSQGRRGRHPRSKLCPSRRSWGHSAGIGKGTLAAVEPVQPQTAEGDQGQADDLRHPQASGAVGRCPHQAERIDPQPFNPEPSAAVAHQVNAAQRPCRKLDLPLDSPAKQPEQQQQHPQVPDRLVEERGVKGGLIQEFNRPVRKRDGQFPGQVGRKAKRLGIKEVPPAADRLTQGDGGQEDIQQIPEGDLAPTAVEDHRQGPSDERPVDGDASSPNG